MASSPVAWRYELLLRLTDLASSVAHVPRVLWSAPADADEPPDASEVERQAVEWAIARRSLDAEVGAASVSRVRRIRWTVNGQPKVSIVIPTTGNMEIIRPCVRSILDRPSMSPTS